MFHLRQDVFTLATTISNQIIFDLNDTEQSLAIISSHLTDSFMCLKVKGAFGKLGLRKKSKTEKNKQGLSTESDPHKSFPMVF